MTTRRAFFLAVLALFGRLSNGRKFIGEWQAETGFYQSLDVKESSPIFSKKSKYQDIEVHESDFYGKILVLDGVVQLTDRDANSYNEMMAQMPMMHHKHPKRVLIIGGGDGYVLSEVLKHDSLVHVDHVDLDDEVISTCKEFFPWSKAWDDPRVALHVSDGAEFVRRTADGSYDVIIQDSSDPWTYDDDGNKIPLPSGVLYTPEHFGNIHRALTPGGVFNFQAETFNIPSDLEGIRTWRKVILNAGFSVARYGSITISSYPTGQIGFLLCEKDSSLQSSSEEIQERFLAMESKGLGTTYYQPRLQTSSFDLPLWVEKKIYSEEPSSKDEL